MNLFEFFKKFEKGTDVYCSKSIFFEIDQFFLEIMIYKTVLFKTSFYRSSAEIKISM